MRKLITAFNAYKPQTEVIKDTELGVLGVQEHNMTRDEEKDAVRMAKLRGFTLTMSFGRADAPESERGGVFLLTKDAIVTHRSVKYKEEGLVRCEVTWGTKTLDVAVVYAPSNPLKRVDFFNSLKNKIEKTTLVGGDFNTVGDVTLDVASRNPLAYPNIGGALLSQIMGDKGLVDERREQLGSEVEYTRKGNTTNGVTSTRLDR